MKYYGKGKARKKPGVMNKTEARYAAFLEEQKTVGIVQWFKYEGAKLRLADNTFYTPDFMVLNSKDEIEFHEVKGFWLQAARIKIKVAADIYPFRFISVQLKAGQWSVEEF